GAGAGVPGLPGRLPRPPRPRGLAAERRSVGRHPRTRRDGRPVGPARRAGPGAGLPHAAPAPARGRRPERRRPGRHTSYAWLQDLLARDARRGPVLASGGLAVKAEDQPRFCLTGKPPWVELTTFGRAGAP